MALQCYFFLKFGTELQKHFRRTRAKYLSKEKIFLEQRLAKIRPKNNGDERYPSPQPRRTVNFGVEVVVCFDFYG